MLYTIFGEVVNNCEIHSGKGAVWFTHGHYQIKESVEYGEMQLLFFHFGNTIYENFQNDEVSEETRIRIKKIINRHKKFFNKNWTQEMLCTLFSLQESVSRFRDGNISEEKDRGTGTVKLIINFNEIGQALDGHEPLMTITSGYTQIRFGKDYRMENVQFNDDIFGNKPRKIIAFNQTNDIYLPPDSKAVIRLENYFPGTIISLKFFLDREYIKTITK